MFVKIPVSDSTRNVDDCQKPMKAMTSLILKYSDIKLGIFEKEWILTDWTLYLTLELFTNGRRWGVYKSSSIFL